MLDDSCKIIWCFYVFAAIPAGCSSRAFCLGERDCHWWVPSIMKVDTLICSDRRTSYLEGCIFYKNTFSLPSLIPFDSTHHCPVQSIKPSANHTFLKSLSTIRHFYLLSLVSYLRTVHPFLISRVRQHASSGRNRNAKRS
jgi:hypothetical protein